MSQQSLAARTSSASMSNSSNVRRRSVLLSGVALALIVAVFAIWLQRDSKGPNEVTIAALDLRDDTLFLKGTDEKRFDGLLIENYSQDRRKLEISIENGRAHGLSRGWYDNGQIEVEESFVNGVSHGVRKRWYLNGSQKSEALIVNGEIDGSYRLWHENGILAAEMEMNNGRIQGLAQAWYPSGAIKSRVTFVDGVEGEKEFFPDALPVARVENTNN